jgi:hypothetical protein
MLCVNNVKSIPLLQEDYLLAVVRHHEVIRMRHFQMPTVCDADGKRFGMHSHQVLTQLLRTHLLRSSQARSFRVAGREGLEPPTDGFGDRYSTN